MYKLAEITGWIISQGFVSALNMFVIILSDTQAAELDRVRTW